jgi:hypothetical protein
MKAHMTLLAWAAIAVTAILLVTSERVLAQGCPQRGATPGAGSNSLLGQPPGGQFAGLQNQGLNQLAALQQQQAMAQAMQMQQAMAAMAARRQAEAAAQAERRQREQDERAAQFRQIGDRFRAEDKPALAIQNYRRAMAAAPASAAGLAAQAELESYQADAEDGLAEVQELIAAREFDEASTRLSSLKRDYGKLKVGSRITSMISRVGRMKGQSQAVATEVAVRSKSANTGKVIEN